MTDIWNTYDIAVLTASILNGFFEAINVPLKHNNSSFKWMSRKDMNLNSVLWLKDFL